MLERVFRKIPKMDIYVPCKESVGEGDWVGWESLVPRPSTAKQLQSNGRIWVRGYCKGKGLFTRYDFVACDKLTIGL